MSGANPYRTSLREQTETNPIGQRTERRVEGAADGRLRTLSDDGLRGGNHARVLE